MEPAQPERKRITVLFCDVVSSSALSEALDPEDLREILLEYQALCTDLVRAHDGHVAQFLGDGLLAYFGYPRAHEEMPRRAIQAALAIVRAIKSLSPRLQAAGRVGLQVRIGIHTGAVVMGGMGDAQRIEQLAVGETPNLASRVQSEAAPDTILVSESTHRAAQGFFTFRELGPRALRGFSHPIELFEVVAETGVRSRMDVAAARGLTPFVGRERELGQLGERWAAALRGEGPLVLLNGEPGIGKSRLVRVLRESIEALSLVCFCSPYDQNTAFHPIADMLTHRLGLAREQSPDEKIARMEAELGRAGVDQPNAVALLAGLLRVELPVGAEPLALAPIKQRQATFELLASWLSASAKLQPLLLVVEDLHWADPSTLELIGLIAAQPPASRLLLLLTHRPEFVAPWRGERVVEIAVPRLPREATQQILKSMERGEDLVDDVVDQVLAKADGVPLFVEEIAKAVIESAPARESRPADRARSTTLSIPSNLQDSLVARLDRLGSGKPVLQLAATLGRTFDFDLLLAVGDRPPAALRDELDRLVQAELLFRRGEAPDETYIFKHALIQDAAYESLLRSMRLVFHQRIAEALTRQFPEVARTRPELMARHYSGAGLRRESIAHWKAAGQQAMGRSAFSEAVTAFSRGIEELAALPEARERDNEEIELRAGLGIALISVRGWAIPEVEHNYTRSRELCEKFGDTPARVIYGIWGVQLVRADVEASSRTAALFERLLQSTEDRYARVTAHAALGAFSYFQGNYQRAREHLEEAIGVFEAERGQAGEAGEAARLAAQDYGLDALLYARMYLIMCHQAMGNTTRAWALWDEALAAAEATAHPYTIATALAYGATAAHDAGQPARAAAFAGRLAALSSEHGFHYWLALAGCVGGWAAAVTSAGQAGTTQIEQSLGFLRHVGAFIVYPHYLGYLIEACLLRGDLDRGLALADEGLALTREKLCRNHEPRLLRLKGRLCEARGDLAAAERCYRQVVAVTRSQRASLFELEAARDLARLLQAQGQGEEGETLLAAALAGFAEAPAPEAEALLTPAR